MASELRNTILTAQDIGSKTVEVPEWGVTVLVKGLTAGQRARIVNVATRGGSGQLDFAKVYPDLVIATAHDPASGERIFEDADREALLSKSGAALDHLATAALEVSGMTEAAMDEAKSGDDR